MYDDIMYNNDREVLGAEIKDSKDLLLSMGTKDRLSYMGWDYTEDNTEGASAVIKSGDIKGYVFRMSAILNHSLDGIVAATGQFLDTLSKLKAQKADLILVENADNWEVHVKGEYICTMTVAAPTPEQIKCVINNLFSK